MIPLQEKHSQERTAEPQISPLRCASVEMTKGRVALPERVVAEEKRFFITLGGPKAHQNSGRDDNSVVPARALARDICPQGNVVIPTGSYPDFLHRTPRNDRGGGSP